MVGAQVKSTGEQQHAEMSHTSTLSLGDFVCWQMSHWTADKQRAMARPC